MPGALRLLPAYHAGRILALAAHGSRDLRPPVAAHAGERARAPARLGRTVPAPTVHGFRGAGAQGGCRVSTTTCGLRMDETLAGQIVESGIDIVAFSLVGTDEASNAPRAGVPFSRVREAVRTLQRVRKAKMGVHLELHFAYLMLASQMEAVEGLPDLMDELDVHAAVISTLDYIAAPGLEAEAFPRTRPETGRRPGHTRTSPKKPPTRARPLLPACLPRPDDGAACSLPGKRSPDALRGRGKGACPLHLPEPSGGCASPLRPRP
ncbi:MAG: hypothetical protein ACLR0N_01920 [Bilophila wadsworthia]